MSSASDKPEAGDPLDNPLPIYLIAGLWGVNIVLGALFWCFSFGQKRPPTLWDEESKKSLYCFGQSNYFIRIRTGNCTVNFDHKTTKLKFHILDDKKKKLGSIVIPPTWLANYSQPDPLSNLPDMKMLQFNWSRAKKISNFAFIQASHTCRIPNSSIIIYDVDVRSQSYGLALKSIIGMRVESLRDSNEEDQVAPFKAVKITEDDIWISPARLTFCHFTIVGLFYTSTVAIISLAGPSDFSEEEIADSMINGLVAVPVCLLMSFLLIFLRNSMRKNFYPFSGTELADFDMAWSAVWFMDAVGMAVYSLFETFQLEEAQIFQWTYTSAIAQLICTVLMVVIYAINERTFKSNKKEIKNDSQIFGDLKKPDQEKSDLTDLAPPKTPSVGSVGSTGSTYWEKLMKDTKLEKVKSISQYGPVTHV